MLEEIPLPHSLQVEAVQLCFFDFSLEGNVLDGSADILVFDLLIVDEVLPLTMQST